jgi:hypothetical protein
MHRRTGISLVSAAMLALLLPLALACLGRTASAQHLISTKAGFINRVEGKVSLQRQDSEEDEVIRASLGTQMKDGDRLSTATDSYAEILLNPGSYLRLDQKTEVRAVNTALTAVRFELLKGSVIIEVSTIDKKLPLEIGTPHGPVASAKAGLYRLDLKKGETVVRVQRGELFLGTREQLLAKSAIKIGKGKLTHFTAGFTGKPEIAKFDADLLLDDFDQWSFQRAETLVAANYAVLRRAGYDRTLAFGWIFDPFFNCYTFIPRSWYAVTPYGFSFYRNFGDCGCYFYYPRYGSGNYGGGTTTAGGSNPRPSSQPRVTPNNSNDGRTSIRREIPPSRRIDSDSPGSSVGSSRTFDPGRRIDSGGSSRGSIGGGSRTVDTGSGGSRGTSGGGSVGGDSPAGGGSRSVETGGGASRGSSGGGSSSPPPRSPEPANPRIVQ